MTNSTPSIPHTGAVLVRNIPLVRGRTTVVHITALLTLMWAVVCTSPVVAQNNELPPNNPDEQSLLLADEIQYDADANTITASGKVEIQRGPRILLADAIVYDRTTDVATATGNVSLLDDNGTVFFFERIEVAGDLKEGLAREVRVLLSDGSRMASRTFLRRQDGVSELYESAYTACDSCKGSDPLWQIKADRVRYDSDEEMVYYRNAWLELGGLPVFYTPYLAHPDPTAGSKSGLLLPTIGGGRNLGVAYQQPYFFAIAPDKDATITPFLTSSAGNGATGEYRQNFRRGQVRLFGSLMGGDPELNEDIRGHIDGLLRFDIDDHWRVGADINLATDRTFLRRYSFDAPTWLTTNVFAERFSKNTYFSANAYYFQRQRLPIAKGSVPVVAPALDFNYVSEPGFFGGYWDVDANGLVILREDGTDTNRLSTKVGWNLPFTTSLGEIYTFRASVRADGYYVHDFERPLQGDVFTGTAGRVVPEASLEWRMPFVNDQWGFHQIFEPIVMAVVSPIGLNHDTIPNEDSLDLEFDDTNLFQTQRFSGVDRVESGPRVNYGFRWSGYNGQGGAISALIGQVYRFHSDSIFSQVSGLDGRLSDYVGRIDVSPHPYVSMQYRFRLDKKTFANRRSEFSAAIGPRLLRLRANYIFLEADTTLTSPGDTEELFVSLSSRLSRNWSVTASHRENLGPGGGRIRTNVGLTYEDECIIVGLDLANDNTEDRDFRRGVSVLLRINLKTIGDISFNTDVGARR
jgi:LPS-assembly protein